ncbi:MAG: M48 family metallopeptidase [Acidobacteriota bacterium]
MRTGRFSLLAGVVILGLALIPVVLAGPLPAGSEEAAKAAGEAARDPYTVVVTDEMRAHQRWLDTLYFAGALYGFVALLAVLALGISRRLRDLAQRVTSRRFLGAMVFFALFSAVMTLLTIPLDYLSGYFVPHRFNLSEQSLPAWLWDQLKGFLLGIALGAPVMALALGGIRRVRRWWLALWIGAAPIAVFLILIGPVVLDPVFNKFEPLKDEALKTELLDLASAAGITGGRVFEVDKSKQTTTMNAYVNGLGPTKRIVLWDTIIAKMDHDELRFVMAHEMGHYVLHHMWKGLAFILALLFVVLLVGQRVVEWATRRWGGGWGFEVPHDPAAVPLLLLVVSAGMFLLTPVMNGFSRAIERESDIFSLELTHLNDAGARSFVKFAEDSKVLPDPHPFVRFWRYSHPTLAERVKFCRSYKPWVEGLPNTMWRPAAPAAN